MKTQRLRSRFRSAARALFMSAAILSSAPSFAFQVSNGKILDDQGNRITIKGVNWFGAETSNRVVHGLWIRSNRKCARRLARRAAGFPASRSRPSSLQVTKPNCENPARPSQKFCGRTWSSNASIK